MSNGSLNILKSPRVCHVLEFVKLRKSHCNQGKFGIFSNDAFLLAKSAWYRILGYFLNSELFHSDVLKRFHIKI